MLRFSKSTTTWLLTLCVMCSLLAWPLHEAQHAREPIAQLAASLAIDASAQADHGDCEPEGQDGGATSSSTCVWGALHAGHFALQGTPPSFSFHAEASAPPPTPEGGLPRGRCTLAAEPRGPPAQA